LAASGAAVCRALGAYDVAAAHAAEARPAEPMPDVGAGKHPTRADGDVNAALDQRGNRGLVSRVDLTAAPEQRTVDVGDEQAIGQRRAQAAG
jgi:hypothetical protein